MNRRLARASLALGVVVVLHGCYAAKESDGAPGAGTDGFSGDETGGAPPGGDESGSDDGNGQPPPETEDEGDFRVPRASGRFVYSASETTDSVAVIDSVTLAIDVVTVGRGPTVVAPLTADGVVAVLDQTGNDVAILRTDDEGRTTVEILAVSPGGALLYVYHDVDGPEALGPGSDQELTVLEVATSQAHEMTVGAHPRDVVFDATGSTAYVVTDDGVNVIPTAELAMIDKPDLVPVVDDPAIDPATLEIHVSADQRTALARIAGDPRLFATDLASGEQFTFELPGPSTDLDVATDGSFAIVTLPSTSGSRFVELALPLGPGDEPVVHDVAGEYVGLAHLSPDGQTMLLYTTVDPFMMEAPLDPGLVSPLDPLAGGSGGSSSTGETTGSTGDASTGGSTTTDSDGGGDDGPGDVPSDQDPRQRVTIARRDGGTWAERITLFVDHPVVSVGMAPDGANAMLLHEIDPELPATPWSYTLLDLTKEFPVKKLQVVEAEPGPVVFTPDGDRSVVLLRDDSLSIRRVDLVDLRSFIVDALDLGSPPEGAGYVDATEKIFVSQEHPTGRITFLDRDGNVETVTGYRLNDAVKD
jgi:hypothetical protein